MIAVCALLLSAIAALASVLQTRVIANQLSATVWPYIAFSLFEENTRLKYTIENDGLGPAILRSATLTLDGARRDSLRGVALALLHGTPRRSSLHSSSIGVGQVLRPGESIEIMGLVGPQATVLATEVQRHMTVSVCYCSLLDQCWTVTSLVENKGPARVARCAEGSGIGP